MKQYTIGIDLGGTTITAGLVNEEGEILAQKTCDTALPRPADAVEETMVQLCQDVLAQTNLSIGDLQGVGIGTPGSVDSTSGVVGFNANFGYVDWALAAHMEKKLGCPVKIENDANAAAYGEYCKGAARGKSSALVVTLGTGIGGGFILNGTVFSGFNGAGVEIGHTVIVKGGRPCSCGRRGCWEKYASARALAQDAAIAMKEHPESALWKLAGSPEKMNARAVFDAILLEDETARQVFEVWIDSVGCGLANLINVFQPEVVCIGGGVSRQGDVLLKPLRTILDREDFARNLRQRTKVKVCTLFNEAGLIGAAYLARA